MISVIDKLFSNKGEYNGRVTFVTPKSDAASSSEIKNDYIPISEISSEYTPNKYLINSDIKERLTEAMKNYKEIVDGMYSADNVPVSGKEETVPEHINEEIDKGSRILRKTKITNRYTNTSEDMYLLKDKDGVISIHSGKEKLGKMVLREPGDGLLNSTDIINASDSYKDKDYLEIFLLETKNNGRNASIYKGLGTELVKQAIMESIKAGHSGRLALIAANYKLNGREAAGFYGKLGFQHCGEGNQYCIPENKINFVLG